MYYTIQSFIAEYQEESALTQKLLDALTDASLACEVAPGRRTLGHIAWHLVTSVDMLKATGLEFAAPEEDSKVPAEAAVIAKEYRLASQAVAKAVQSQWTDDKLEESVNMYGEMWKNGFTLYSLIKHEIHHRGQLTVLMRQAGLRVTGVYGPSQEEWAGMGMEAPV